MFEINGKELLNYRIAYQPSKIKTNCEALLLPHLVTFVNFDKKNRQINVIFVL